MKTSSLFTAALLLLGISTAESRAGLIGFYPFDDPSDPRKDESASAPTAGLGYSLESSPGPESDPVFEADGGVNGSGAFVFDGSQRLATAFDISPSVYPTLTMGAWVKTSTLNPGLRKAIGHDDGGWDRAIGLDTRQTGVFAYSTFTGGGVLNSGKTPPSTEAWAFIAATYDQAAGIVTLYVDEDISTGGLTVRTTSGTFGEGWWTASIGSLNPSEPAEGWVGTIDNVFFYDEVLSPERIAEIRDGGKNAILEVAGAEDDPNLRVVNTPDLVGLPKTPEVKTLAYQINNSGSSAALNISGVTISGPDAGHFSVRTFPESIAAGANGTIEIDFDTMGQTGNFFAEMQITSNDESTSQYIIDLNPSVVAPALLGFYSFDDAASPLKDDSGANRTLTAPAAPVHEPAGGVEGGAYLFDGSQRLVAPININPGVAPNLTMGAWVRTDALEGFHKIMGHDNGGWDRTLGLDPRPEILGFTYYTAFTGGNNYPLSDPPAIPESTEAWSFVAVVYEQGLNLVTSYIDLDVSTTDDPLLTGTTTTGLGEGATSVGIGSLSPVNANEGWVGSIDNVFFINGVLDAAQMEDLRDTGKAYFLEGLQPDPILTVLGGPAFGDLPSSSPLTANIRISNAGATQPLRLSRAELLGPDAGLYTLGDLPDEIAPGEEAVIPVTLTPGDRTGGVSAELRLYSNNSGSRFSSIDLAAYVPYSSARSALVAFYPFDDEANPLADASGNAADATLVEGAEPIHEPANGFEGGAYLFGGGQYLSAPVNINPSVAPKMTMGAWVTTHSLDAINSKIMGHDNGGWDRAIGLDNRGTAGLTPVHYTAFAGRNAFPLTDPPATPVSIENWTFIAAVYDQLAATVTTYIDLDAASTEDPLQMASVETTMGAGQASLGIGAIAATGSETWLGQIDNVFVYYTGLTEQQITALRNGGAAAILGDEEPELRITEVERNGNLTLTWTSTDGTSYSVQYMENIDGTWQDIATVTGNGSSTSYTDTDATRLARPAGFYRIVQP